MGISLAGHAWGAMFILITVGLWAGLIYWAASTWIRWIADAIGGRG